MSSFWHYWSQYMSTAEHPCTTINDSAIGYAFYKVYHGGTSTWNVR